MYYQRIKTVNFEKKSLIYSLITNFKILFLVFITKLVNLLTPPSMKIILKEIKTCELNIKQI